MNDTTPHTVTVATYIRTTNTRSGNPRRGWIVREVIPGQPYAAGEASFVDEGYEGTSALHDAFPGAVITCSVDVTPQEYRERVRRAEVAA
jgi:hypothetical protein